MKNHVNHKAEGLFQVESTIPVLHEDSLSRADWSVANFIVHGDANIVARSIPPKIFNTIVTSPPYFGQRNYEVQDQIGSEETPSEYVSRLVSVLRSLSESLRDDGTLWLNLGDKYKEGSLLGLPWRVALALIDDGWVLRSDVIWHKPNAMPHSVKTRPTTDHEYIFLFSKGSNYYYDADSIREPHITFTESSKMRGGRNHIGKRGGTPEEGKNAGNSNLHDGRWDQAFHPLGRNKRTVWSVPVGRFRDAHFAVFPPKLIEPCILAGSPRDGLVLDPFLGSGTTGLVSLNHGRRFVGVDLNEQYCRIAQNRMVT